MLTDVQSQLGVETETEAGVVPGSLAEFLLTQKEYGVPDEETIRERNEIDAYNHQLEQKADKRHERVLNCGRPLHRLDPGTGMRVRIVPHCDNWHECENCRRMRLEQVSSLVSLIVAGGPTWAVVCVTGSENAQEAVAEGKSSYMSFPLEKADSNGNDLLILVDHPVTNGVAVRPMDLNLWDMTNVTCTPEGRRITGKLRKPAAVGSKTGPVVRLLGFTTEAPESTVVEMFTEAVLETTGEDPHGAQEIEKAVYKRVALWANKLRNAGYVTKCSYSEVKLNVLSSWLDCTFNFLRERGLVIPRRHPKQIIR